VEFTLDSAIEGVWKVYAQESGGDEHPGVYAVFDPVKKKLSLISISTGGSIAPGDYWVTVTGIGKAESARLKLTVLSQQASADPQVQAASVEKTAAEQAAVEFTLGNDYAAGTVWTVYAALEGAGRAPGVAAAHSGQTLTLSHAGDVPAGDYYVSAREPGKIESGRIKLTVDGYTADGQTRAPKVEAGSVMKTAAEQAAVEFTLSNDPQYAAGTVWRVYAAASGTETAAGVSAAHSGQTLTLSHGSDVPAGDYYVAAQASGLSESGRLKLTVIGFTAAGQTPQPQAVSAAAAKDPLSLAGAAFVLSNYGGYPPGTEWTVYTAASGAGTAAGVTAELNGAALTLRHTSDIPVGDYYVSAKRPGDEFESGRLKLTVLAPVSPAPRAVPSVIAKTGPVQEEVEFTLSNDYGAGTVWTVYAAASGSETAAGMSAAHSGRTLTLRHNSGNVPAGDYYVSAQSEGMTESGRYKLTVQVQQTTPTPLTAIDSKKKTAYIQASVQFTLSNENDYGMETAWAVYLAVGDTIPAARVRAEKSGSRLTLIHLTDIPAGNYYVAAREPGKIESGRLRLTVEALAVSAAPEAANASGKKDQAVQPAVSFVLTSTHSGVWKVYEETANGYSPAGVTAAFSTPNLTLTAANGNLNAGVYYVSVTQSGKGESPRLALTVQDYTDPAGTPIPKAGSADLLTQYKAGRTAASVPFVLINEYEAGVAFTVSPAGTAAWNAASKTLTLSYGSDIPAGVYQVSAQNPGKAASAPQQFTVKAASSAQITVRPPVIPGEPALISGNTTAPQNGGMLVVTIAPDPSIEVSVGSWRMDGVVIPGETSLNAVLAVNNLSVGRHRIAVIMSLGGVPYSQELTFTVTQ
jgi:hypothetical protein